MCIALRENLFRATAFYTATGKQKAQLSLWWADRTAYRSISKRQSPTSGRRKKQFLKVIAVLYTL